MFPRALKSKRSQGHERAIIDALSLLMAASSGRVAGSSPFIVYYFYEFRGFMTETPSDMQTVISSVPVDHSGTTIYLKGWRRERSERHPIIIVHDLGEHTELYRDTAIEFLEAGYPAYIFDLRGHGRSGRRLGHAPSFNVLVKDLLQVAAWVRHKEGGKAPVIVGHGIGALIAIEFTKRHGAFARAAVLSAPCLELVAEVSVAARFAIKILSEVSPTLRIPAALSPRFAKDLKVAQAETEEGHRAHYFPRLTAIFARELLTALDRTEATFIEYHGSVLILCPEKDEICSYGRVKKSAALHDEHNLRIAELPGLGHAVFTEGEEPRRQALGIILPWLEQVMKGRPQGDVKIEGASRADVVRVSAHEDEKPGATKL